MSLNSPPKFFFLRLIKHIFFGAASCVTSLCAVFLNISPSFAIWMIYCNIYCGGGFHASSFKPSDGFFCIVNCEYTHGNKYEYNTLSYFEIFSHWIAKLSENSEVREMGRQIYQVKCSRSWTLQEMHSYSNLTVPSLNSKTNNLLMTLDTIAMVWCIVSVTLFYYNYFDNCTVNNIEIW